MSETTISGYELWLRNPPFIQIEDSWQRIHRQNMADLKARYEYNMNPDNIPTWMGLETYCLMQKLKDKNKENKTHYGTN